jgi:hypothetical protein
LEDCCIVGTSCDKNNIVIVFALLQNCEHSIEGHRKDFFSHAPKLLEKLKCESEVKTTEDQGVGDMLPGS